MNKYITDDFSVETSFDSSHFGDFEIVDVIENLKAEQLVATFIAQSGGSIDCTPVFHGNKVFFVALDHNLYALDTDTGQELWRFSSGAPCIESLDIYRDTLYFGSFDGNFYAVSTDGKLLWKFQAGDKIAHFPAFTEGRVHFGCKDRCVYTLDAVTGRLLWKFPTKDSINSLNSHDNVLYVVSWDSHIYALDPETGGELWRFDASGIASSPVLVHGDSIYFGSTGKILGCLTLDGKLKWKVNVPDGIRAVETDGKRIFANCRDNNTYSYDLKGNRLWVFRTKDMLSHSLRLIDGTLYIGSCDHHLYAVDPETGKEKWRFGTGGLIANCPSKKDGRIFFGSWDCNLYCITDSGELIWKSPTSMGSPSGFNMDELPLKRNESFTVKWDTSLPEEGDSKYRSQEDEIKQYGEFSGRYIDVGKTHYASSSKKNYIEKKKF